MSGLQGFVHRRENRERSRPPIDEGSQNISADRLARARGVKIPLPKQSKNSAETPSNFSNAMPTLDYTSNPTIPRSTYPTDIPQQQSDIAYRNTFEEGSVGDDFDETRSEIDNKGVRTDSDDYSEPHRENYGQPYSQGQAPRFESQQIYTSQNHLMHRHQKDDRQSPITEVKDILQGTIGTLKVSGISGRFLQTQKPPQHPELQTLSHPLPEDVSPIAYYTGNSGKRSRSNDRSRRSQKNQNQDGFGEDSLTPPRDSLRRQEVPEENQDLRGLDTKGTSTPPRYRKHRATQNPPGSYSPAPRIFHTLDHNDDVLRDMKYTQLKAERWEMNPNPRPFEMPEELQGSESTLGDRMKYILNKHDFEIQTAFYSQLSTAEWEDTGDWFLERFSDLLRNIKEKRQEKRKVAEKFEAEIEARETSIKSKSEALDKKFERMRASGQELLRGKVA